MKRRSLGYWCVEDYYPMFMFWKNSSKKYLKLQLLEHVAKVQPLSPCQHGFCCIRSTVSNLLSCDAVIADLMNQNEAFDIISFDFKQAFEKVPHHCYLTRSKLYSYIIYQFNELVASCLADRNVLSLMTIFLMLRQLLQESFKVLYLGLHSL